MVRTPRCRTNGNHHENVQYMRTVAVIWEQVDRKSTLCKAPCKDVEADNLTKSQTEHTLQKSFQQCKNKCEFGVHTKNLNHKS